MDIEAIKDFPDFKENSSWGEGEWLTEPDMLAQIKGEYKGYPYILTRNFGGSWCGYVAVDGSCDWILVDKYSCLDVHGGVTWSDHRLPWEENENIETFWIGFDCAHYHDYSPRHEKILEQTGEILGDPYKALAEQQQKLKANCPVAAGFWNRTYKTLEFARNEIESMIDQIDE